MSNAFITRQHIVIALHDLIDGAKEVHNNVFLPLWEHKYKSTDSATVLSTELTKSMPRVPPAPTTYHLLTTQLRTTYTQFEFCHTNKQGTKRTPKSMILRILAQPLRRSVVGKSANKYL